MIRVGVIRGGISSEYEVSLKTGSSILSHLKNNSLINKYKAIDIFIDKEGVWHIKGKPVYIENVFHSVDVIFNALHGDFGEDGKVQQILDQWQIPYTGSGAFASALGYNKILSKEQFVLNNIKTPKYILISKYNTNIDEDLDIYSKRIAKYIHDKMPPKWILKPVSSGSSFGMRFCKTYVDLINAFREGINIDSDIIVEELIEGKEATVGVINNFRNKKIYSLPPVEIRVPKHKDFFDYDAKYSGISQETCPGNFTNKEKEELEKLACLIHNNMNLSHYSRSDFIIHPKQGIYALEVNTLPGLTNESLFPKMLDSVGSNLTEFIDHLITSALKK